VLNVHDYNEPHYYNLKKMQDSKTVAKHEYSAAIT